jgi:hypothetical protein
MKLILIALALTACAPKPSCPAREHHEYVEQVDGCDWAGTCQVRLRGGIVARASYPTAGEESCVWEN